MELRKLQDEMPYSWKIQSKSKDGRKASFVAYIDARDVMKRLDDVVGPENWTDSYTHLPSGSVICNLAIKCGDDWVNKEDVGTPSDYEKEKGANSDAFKRAAVKWGIGRFLYDLAIQWLPINEYGEPLDERGVKIPDLIAFFSNKLKNPHSVPATQEPVIVPEEPIQKVCVTCGKNHTGKYPKCWNCYTASKRG